MEDGFMDCNERVWSVLVIELRVTWKMKCGEKGLVGQSSAHEAVLVRMV